MEQNSTNRNPTVSVVEPMEKKSNTGLILAIVVCAVLAVGGIGYGAWATVSGNSQSDSLRKQVNDLKQQVNDLAGEEVYNETDATIVDNNETVVIAEKTIDNNLAQSLINPFLKTFNYLSNMLDYEFNEDVKAEVAFKNVEPGYSLTESRVDYYDLNKQYEELFGGTLEKRDYAAGHTDMLKYVDGSFEVSFHAGGGTGSALFSVVKNAKYDGQNVVVEVYHDRITVCGINANDGYCIDAEGKMGAVVDSIEEYNVKELIEKFSDRIPVYKMTFTKNNGHYVLSAVEKES